MIDLIQKLKSSGVPLLDALKDTAKFGGEVVMGGLSALDPRQLVPGTEQFLPTRMGNLGTSVGTSVHQLATELTGSQGFDAQALSQEVSTRSAELADRITSMVRSGRLDVTHGRDLLASLPQAQTAPNASPAAAFEAGTKIGLGATAAASMVGDLAGRLPKKQSFDSEVQRLSNDIDELNQKVQERIATQSDENQRLKVTGAAIEGDKSFPGPGAMGKGQTGEALSPLASEAVKYKTAEDFHKAFFFDIKHGQYWHVTDDPNFSIDPTKGPRDMSTMGVNVPEVGKLMVTSDLPRWADFYDGSRGYAALIDMGGVPPQNYGQVNRGFGNELFVDDPSRAKVVKVVPIQEALKESARYDFLLDKNVGSKTKLIDFWNKTVKNTAP